MNKILDQENNLLSLNAIKEESIRLNNIGLIVKKHRAKRGITRKLLASLSGISIRYLAQLEAGKANPTISILKNIAYALNMSLSDMLFENEYNEIQLGTLDNKLSEFSSEQLKKVHNLVENIYRENTVKKNKNKIAFIGLRGAGKSTLGNMLYKEFNTPVFEVSNEIEILGGMNINEIIELGGQGMYRRFEYDIVSSFHKNHDNLILLTGGSIVSEKETYNYLLNNYFTVWIKASPMEHMSRVLMQGDSRPMNSNPRAMEDLNNILNERVSLYSKADLIIDTENSSIKESYSKLKLKLFKT
ncbi:helix-turn-helix domain-containing protein [Alphaproteobacteria bacterium]|jgi:XRE family aerobic/anaerobic benzoate catabolism transcriptional regulator|nr:helix-turn-helix domain-containing protein [Alphaproteobacteria bacterium]|tara:strand:- start:995 stop:1897 length:903 start_codon:yes stop_codon:yes gene_type:complete